jgi:hypothetical protein
MMLEEIPEWLAAAVLAAVFAAVGYVCKQVLEWLITLRSSHRTRKARLVALLSLLRGSGAVFRVQATLRNRLYTALISGHPSLEQAHEGYEALFSAAFKTFTPEQRELHALVYLADEENHGVPFPRGVEGAIETFLGVSPVGRPNPVHATD